MSTKINDLYSQSKSRSFVLHLVRAYVPVYKLQKVFEKDTKNMKCCLCGTKLISVDELFQKTIGTEGVMEAAFNHTVDKMLNPEAHVNDKRIDNPIIKAIDGKVQGFTGDKTETKICLHCFEELLSFTQDKILTQDKQIVFAIKKEMAKDFPDAIPTITALQDEQKRNYERRKMKANSKPNAPDRATNSLADFMSPETRKKLGL